MNDTGILESEARIESWAHHLLAVHPWAGGLIYFHSSQSSSAQKLIAYLIVSLRVFKAAMRTAL